MEWIFLSPHFDDAALSCGGILWELANAGSPVSVWTIFGGDPQNSPLSEFAALLHERWNTGAGAVIARQNEDITSCRRAGAAYRHFQNVDCIYRYSSQTGSHFYTSNADLFGEIHPEEADFTLKLREDLLLAMPEQAQVVSPLAIGNHVDHQITRAAAEGLGRELLYYADYPYVLKDREQVEKLHLEGWREIPFEVTDEGLEAWIESVAAYASQASTFWADSEEMRAALSRYARELGGARLWQPPKRIER
jgi:LmbE family N-acetylglucosaminyl deacetylase